MGVSALTTTSFRGSFSYRSEETLERAVIMSHYRGRAIRFVQFRANNSFVVSLSPVEKDEKNVFDLRNSLGAGGLSLIYVTHFNSKHKYVYKKVAIETGCVEIIAQIFSSNPICKKYKMMVMYVHTFNCNHLVEDEIARNCIRNLTSHLLKVSSTYNTFIHVFTRKFCIWNRLFSYFDFRRSTK